MARPAPNNPEMLAALVASLRATAEGRTGTPMERTVGERARAGGVDPVTAATLVARFDRINPAIRRTALGQWFDHPPVDLVPMEPAATGTTTPASGLPGRRFDALRAGLPDAVLEAVSDGVASGTPSTYTVTYQGMFCEGETNWDGFSNSDEVLFQTFATHYDEAGKNETRAETHPIDKQVYEDVDRGEVRIGPVAAVWQGQRLPMSLTVVAWEHDYGDPDKYRDEIKAIVVAGAALIGYLYAPGIAAKALITALTPLIVDGLNWLLDTGDDRIGEPVVEVLDFARIEELGNNQQRYYTYDNDTKNSNLFAHFFTHHRGSGAHYVAGFKVERDPAFEPEIIIV